MKHPFFTQQPFKYTGTLSAPFGITYDETGDRIAVLSYLGNVTVFDGADMSVITTVTFTSDKSASAIGYDSVNNRFFVGSDRSDGKIYIIDGTTYDVTDSGIAFATTYVNIRDFAFDYMGDRLFVSCYGQGGTTTNSKIVIFKISDLSLIDSFEANRSCGIFLDANKLYVAGHASGNIRIYDATNYSTIATIAISDLIYSVTPDPDNSNLLIASGYNNSRIYLIDKTTNTVKGAFSNVPNPRFSMFRNGEIYTTSAGLNRILIMDKFYS